MSKLTLFAMMLGAPRQDAWDVAQQAFTDAYPHWPAIASPGAYLRTSVTRALARGRRLRREYPVAGLPDWPAPSADVHKAVELDERRRQVLATLRRLPLRQRQIMAWTLDGYEPAEIAHALQIRPGTVRVNLHKARASLRRLLLNSGSVAHDEPAQS